MEPWARRNKQVGRFGFDRELRKPTEEEKPVPTPLPAGYRLVAIASDNWVLVSPEGSWVGRYRGTLDLREAALDAGKHHYYVRGSKKG